jgi:hypothetical protein
LADKFALIFRRKRRRNVAGTIDDITKEGSHVNAPNWLMMYDVPGLIIDLFIWVLHHPDQVSANTTLFHLKQQFAWLGGLVEDGQKHFAVSFLGGTAIMAKYDAIQSLGGGKFYWTRARLEALKNQLVSTQEPDQVADYFGIDRNDVQRGMKKLSKIFDPESCPQSISCTKSDSLNDKR